MGGDGGEEGWVPFPWGVRFLVEVVKTAAFPCGAFANLKAGIVAIEGDGIRAIGLKFDGICTSSGGSFDEFEGGREFLAVVGGEFCDDVAGRTVADGVACDLEVR